MNDRPEGHQVAEATDSSPTATSLADDIAAWIPPWQHENRADTPPDEPVEFAEPTRDGVAERPDEPEPEADLDEPASLPLSQDLAATLEAILMVSAEPVTETVLAQTLGRPEGEVTGTLRRLAAEYTGDGRGFDLRKQAGGWRYYTRDTYAPHVERFVLDGQQVRLTKAALETLAVVAYRQPVTRGRISAIRGVNCDGVIRTLVTRGLIAETGTEPDTGANLYCTTTLFLEKLGLNSVAELPPLAPFLPDDITKIGEADER